MITTPQQQMPLPLENFQCKNRRDGIAKAKARFQLVNDINSSRLFKFKEIIAAAWSNWRGLNQPIFLLAEKLVHKVFFFFFSLPRIQPTDNVLKTKFQNFMAKRNKKCYKV
jgi:hypothetical protein